MSQTLNKAIEQLKQDMLDDVLSQCTEKQQELFHRVFPKITADNIASAIGLCERTIRKNQQLGRTAPEF